MGPWPKFACLLVCAVAISVGLATFVGAGGPHVFGVSALTTCALLAFAVNLIAFIPASVAQTERYYDITGTLTYLSVVGLALWSARHALAWRAVVVAIMVTVWAARLGLYLFARVRRDGKDGRFDEIKRSWPRFGIAWTLQGLWVFLTSFAATVIITTSRPAEALTWLDVVGGATWFVGMVIEVVADRQKKVFRADPANAGRFIQTGLWAWSRHPNYVGEITLWFGVAVMGVSTFEGARWLGFVSPVFVYLLLTRVSGVPMLEARADLRWASDPDYQRYKVRTPVLWPRPPR